MHSCTYTACMYIHTYIRTHVHMYTANHASCNTHTRAPGPCCKSCVGMVPTAAPTGTQVHTSTAYQCIRCWQTYQGQPISLTAIIYWLGEGCVCAQRCVDLKTAVTVYTYTHAHTHTHRWIGLNCNHRQLLYCIQMCERVLPNRGTFVDWNSKGV